MNFDDYDEVVSDDQKTKIAAFFLSMAKEFPILRDHPQRIWAVGKARAAQWVHHEEPTARELGILLTTAIEVYPEVTKRLCELITRKNDQQGRELPPRWQAELELVEGG